MNIDAAEEQDGIRFAWNVWPSSRLDATKHLVVPLGCLYTPLKKSNNQQPTVYYEPVSCKNCHSVLNPYCIVDCRASAWACSICHQRNQLPPAYTDMNEQNLVAELYPQCTTIEYILPQKQHPIPPIFLFVVDTCLPAEELQALKDAILISTTLIPEKSLVGLISFGAMVQMHELGFVGCPKSYAFCGNKEVSTKQVQDLLSLSTSRPRRPGGQLAFKDNGFLVPLSDCELSFTTILEELQSDPRPEGKRPMRSTGVALSAAISLLEATYPNTGARVMLFAGGPATAGPGIIVDQDLKEPIRSFSDVLKDKTKYVAKSSKYYEGLAKRAVANGHVVDIFANSLDQVGYMEMRDLVKKTGGVVSLGDRFNQSLFQESYKHMIANLNTLGYNATIEVSMCRELKVCGAIGLMSSLDKQTSSVSETEIGIGNTCAWKACGIDPSTTFSFYFEVVNPHTTPIPAGRTGIIQFQTRYQNSAEQNVLRVTTISRPWAYINASIEPLAAGFDQECAAVLMARMAVFKRENLEDTNDIIRWLDKMLIVLVRKYANYRKGDHASFYLSQEFLIYPQFMFYLRRSNLLKPFGSSLDESTYYRTVLNRETVNNSLLMIQPTLESYSFTGMATPVALSSESVLPERVLLLDTFFSVVVFYGSELAEARKDLHKDLKYEPFERIITAPKEDARQIISTRFPYPRYVECVQGSSQARFVTALLDPTNTPGKGETIVTDDASLKVFMSYLKNVAVNQQ